MRQASRRILLVEDHVDTAKVMARLLNLSGYSVETANTCAAARQICERERFDLLISDVGLPDGTGYELMRQVREAASVPLGIAVSGYGSEQDVAESLQAGFSAHRVKPVAFDTLCSTIQKIIPQ